MPSRRFGEPAREELEATIRTTAGLPDGTRFALEDDDGDSIVLSNSIPNGTKLTLRVLDAKKGALKKRRTHPGGEQGGAKKLRSNTRDGEHRTCVFVHLPRSRCSWLSPFLSLAAYQLTRA